MKRKIAVISDDPYFMSGVSSIFDNYEVYETQTDLLSYEDQREKFDVINDCMTCAIIISVTSVKLMLDIIRQLSDKRIPLLAVFNIKDIGSLLTKIRHIYILSKRATKQTFTEVLRAATSVNHIKDIHLSQRQLDIMKFLMSGVTLKESSLLSGISLKTASAHKMNFLNIIHARNIQQVHGVVIFILAVWCW